MHAFRTRFGRDIVAQFMPPSRPTKHERVIILCDGMPAMPSKHSVLEFFSRKGYWVFHPRYRGSWESGGVFMRESPDRDIGIVIDHLTKGFTDAWSGKEFRLTHPQITLVAASFGGAVALLASRDMRVRKAVVFSPMVDWTARSTAEPLDFLARFTADGFGQGYRPAKGLWAKLGQGDFFNPARHVKELDGSKLLIFHAKDDHSINWRPVARLAKSVGARIILTARGGHMGLGTIVGPNVYKRVKRFLRD